MLKDGDYVRIAASSHQYGTVHQGTRYDDKPGIIFRQDPRLAEKMPDVFILSETEVELCPRPSDVEIQAINKLLAANRPIA